MAKLTRRPLTIQEILRWADAHREATGKWPNLFDGSILGAKFESWGAVDEALRYGFRSLAGGSSLTALLAEHRDARTRFHQPPLTEEQILRWADQHHERTGAWPARKSGAIPETGGEKWLLIDAVLRRGGRGLPGGSSLVRLLAEHRGVRHPKQLPRLTDEQILAWADAYFQRTGEWPKTTSGPISDAPGETWMAMAMALDQGHRGLPGGTTLARLLAEQRGVRNRGSPPLLSIQEILAWADAFHQRTGRWPNTETGPVLEAPLETWSAIDHALNRGTRGLPGGYSLAELLAVERDIRNQVSIPSLTHKQVLVWADAHYRRTGQWPTQHSGPIQEAAHESWRNVDAALRQGARGLPGGSSLPKLLAKYHRKSYRRVRRSRLSKKKILAWADAHQQRTGQWPHSHNSAFRRAFATAGDVVQTSETRLATRGE
jgi:hypothetical protein